MTSPSEERNAVSNGDTVVREADYGDFLLELATTYGNGVDEEVVERLRVLCGG